MFSDPYCSVCGSDEHNEDSRGRCPKAVKTKVDIATLRCTPPPEPKVKLGSVRDLVASPFHAPREYQSASPPENNPSRFAPVGNSEELERILKLPRRAPLDLESPRAEALADMMTARWSRGERACRCAEIDPKIAAGKRGCLKRMKPVQAWALYELGITGGIIASAPVGIGKTFLNCEAALALNEFSPACRVVLCLVPPNLIEQMVLEYELIAEHFRVPEMWVRDGSNRRFEVAGAPVLHVLPYSRLSLAKSSDWIRKLKPDAIIADETDKLKDPQGAGTSRVLRFFFEFGATLFAGWTGSLTDHSLSEYYHLLALALRYGSPLPLDKVVTDEWGRAIDPSDSPAPAGQLLRFCAPGESVHEGFRRRLSETMGVIISTASSSSAELVITERVPPPLPRLIVEALDKLRNEWVRPDTWAGSEYDEELTDAMQVAKCASELACGLFYRWIFPRGEPEALIKEWLEARKDWNRELRKQLLDRREFLDSQMLCEHAAQRAWGDRPNAADLPEWKAYSWPRWREVKLLVRPETQGVRGDDFLAQDAADWAREHRGVVWYGMVEFGQWVSELSGCPLYGGGKKSVAQLVGGRHAGVTYAGEDGSRSVICSLKAHGRGRDGLQRLFSHQLIANPPANATGFEQLLGRMDRQGQAAATVNSWLYKHTPELAAVVEQALRRAEYVEATLGQTQKLRMGYKG